MTKKYEELYQIAKEDFASEIERLSRIEKKATALLSAVTLLVGVYGLVAKWALSQVLPPQDAFATAVLSVSLLAFIGLIFSWVFLFRVLTVDKRAAVAVDGPVVDFYDSNALVDIYYAMSKRIAEGDAHNRTLGGVKTKRLTLGYVSLMITGVFLVVFSLSSAGYAWYANHADDKQQIAETKKEQKMTGNKETDNKPGEGQNGDTAQEPNRDVVAPELQYVQESYDPDKDKSNPKEQK